MADWVIRGVPRALTRDLWWLESAAEAPHAPPPGQRADGGDRHSKRVAALLWLLALADWLFFGQAMGLSLAIFAAAVLAVAMTLSSGPDRLRPALVLGLAALPVVDYVQALSLAILALGLLVSLLMASGGTGALWQRGMQLVADFPLRGIR
ncbi:MAG TPA: hypothetical protein VK146_15030, partial [Tabrizicola sp.]|nr:hypothetical protein [Tabrizicola sp.]